MIPVVTFYHPQQAQQLTGLSYRQLQYWHRSGFIAPTYKSGRGYRLYSFHDLVMLDVASMLRRRGYSIQALRRIVPELKALVARSEASLHGLTFRFEGERVMVFTGSAWESDPGVAVYYSVSGLYARTKAN